MFVELQPSEGLTDARESTSEMAHLHSGLVDLALGWRPQFLTCVDLCRAA